MRIVLAVATGISVALLVIGPITQIRAQQSRPAVAPASIPASASPQATPRVEIDSTLELPPEPDSSVRTTDELVRAQIVRSPAAKPQVKPKPAVIKRSMLARLFLGTGGHRPQPFPRPGSWAPARR
jgi:hypothetical protein